MSSTKKEKSVAQSYCIYMKNTVFVAALCSVLTLFSLPIVVFHVFLYSNFGNAFGNSNESVTTNVNMSCRSNTTSILWDIVEDDTSDCGTMYSGTVCLPYLTEWQECLLPAEKQTSISTIDHMPQDDLEQEILMMQNFLTVNISNTHECQNITVPFLCRYYFPLLDCQSPDSLHRLYSVSKNYCINTSTICSGPWQSAMDDGILSKLPDCLSLPNKDGNHSDITCRDDFVLQGGKCYPRCGEFNSNTPNGIQLILTSEIAAAVLIIVVSICTFSLSFCSKKRLFKFPSIFMLFFVVSTFIAALIILIIAMGRTTLMCSSPNLIEALDEPALFCIISGAIFHYVYLGLIVWWFLHLCVFFYEVMFPFHANQMRKMGKVKKASIVLTVIGILVPLAGVIGALASKEEGYSVRMSPPNVCFPGVTVTFYSMFAPQSILLGIGICFLITIFWRIHMHQSIISRQSDKKQKLTTAEKKLILASLCYAVFGSFSFIFFALASGGAGNGSTALDDYYECESNGDTFGECDRSTFERPIYAPLHAIANISLGFIPIGVFNFLLNWAQIQKAFYTHIRKLTGKKKPYRTRLDSAGNPFSSRTSSKWMMQGSFDQGSENVTSTTDI